MVFAERRVRSRIQRARAVPGGKSKRAVGRRQKRHSDRNVPPVRQGHAQDIQDLRRPTRDVRGPSQRQSNPNHHHNRSFAGEGMKKDCFVCGGELELFQGVRKGVAFQAYRCKQCGELTFDMQQAENYLKAAEKAKEVTVSKWGESLAIRIPKAFAEMLKLKENDKAKIIKEKDGFRIVPIPG